MNLYLFRGLPGSGKTTIAKTICENVFSADDYFTDCHGNYNFNPAKLPEAHAFCIANVRRAVQNGMDVAVANTFTNEWEMEPYFEIAHEFDTLIFSLIVENRHGSKSIHDVPSETVEAMKDRFEISL